MRFKRLEESEVADYLRCGEWRGKAGGYAIQGRAARFVSFVSGSYSNVVGLPLFEGRACLTVHRHAPDFSWQRNMQVRGNLSRSGEGWRLMPRRIVGGFELPEGRLSRFRDIVKKGPGFYRTYRRRMRERS